MNVVPFSGLEVNSRLPLWASAIRFEIASPRPLPVAEFGVREAETV